MTFPPVIGRGFMSVDKAFCFCAMFVCIDVNRITNVSCKMQVIFCVSTNTIGSRSEQIEEINYT